VYTFFCLFTRTETTQKHQAGSFLQRHPAVCIFKL